MIRARRSSGRRVALGQPGSLELVHGDNHRGLVEPHELGELSLSVLAAEGGTQHVVAARRDANRSERGSQFGGEGPMGLVQQPREVAGKALLLRGFFGWLLKLDSHRLQW